MKKAQYFLIILSFISCNTKKNSNEKERYIETQLPFTDILYYKIKDNNWIRNSNNILTVHETFKQNFYKKYLTNETLDQKPFIGGDLYYNITLRNKIDSLIITYPNFENSPKYYKEFWKRRISEHNETTVFFVLKEIKQIINGNEVEIQKEYVDSTFLKLIDIWADYENMTKNKALDHFDFFKSMNMHQSAYNLLYESTFYEKIEFNRDSLKSKLITEKVSIDSIKNRSVFIIDNTK